MPTRSECQKFEGARADGLAAPAKSDRLFLLQVGRGLAACSVALFHIRLLTSAFVEPLPDWLEAVLKHGFLGVDFFFILSGFIILNTHFHDERNVRALKIYVLKRIFRIYVPYWPICSVLIAAYLLFPSLSAVDRIWGWWTSILLVPSIYPPALLVAWTLIHEMLFYAIFIFFYLDSRLFVAVILAWTTAMLVGQPSQGMSPLFSTLLNPINFGFLFGMACALTYRMISTSKHALSLGWCALFIGSLLTLGFFAFTPGMEGLLFAPGATLILLSAVLLEPSLHRRVPRGLVRLGDASYAIYLLHAPLISLTSRAAAKIPVFDNWLASLMLSIVCVVTAGLAFYAFVERPALAAFRRYVLGRI